MEAAFKENINFFKDCIEAAEKVKEDMGGTKVEVKLEKLFREVWKAAGLPGMEGKMPSDKEIEKAVRRSNSNQKSDNIEIDSAYCVVLKGIASVYQECKERNDPVGVGMKLFESVAELFKKRLDKASNVLSKIASDLQKYKPIIAGGMKIAVKAIALAPQILSFCHKWYTHGFEAAINELLEVETWVKWLGQIGGSFIGVWGGVKFGAAVGGWFGPVGAAVGGVFGGIVGGIFGHLAGGWIGKKLCEWAKPVCDTVNTVIKEVVGGAVSAVKTAVSTAVSTVVSTAKKVWGWFTSWF